MKFEVNILGCAAATPTIKRNSTSQILNLHDKYFLVDCGEGTQMQLRKFKFKFQRINHIFISHLHGDHYLGLFGLISSMHLLGRTKDLHIYGPPELKALIDMNNKASQSYLNYHYEFHSTQDKESELIYEDNTLKVTSVPLSHRIPTTGFLFEEKPKKNRIRKEKISEHKLGVEEILTLKRGEDVYREDGRTFTSAECTLPPYPPRKYVYLSDTEPLNKNIGIFKGVDLMYHESTFLEDKLDRAKATFHSTAKQAALVAYNSEAKKLCLGHFSNRYTDTAAFLEEAHPIFSNTILAHDGLKIIVE